MEEMRRLGLDLEPLCPFILNLVRKFWIGPIFLHSKPSLKHANLN
jgi:hypothetical protein